MRWCKSCGAAVEGDPSAAVRCARCGADNPPLQAPPAVSPAVRLLVVGAMAVFGVGFAVLFFFRFEPPPDAAEPTRTARSARAPARGVPAEVYRDDLCFVDANGDDVPDPAVWISDGMEAQRAAAVDGKTGQGIWTSASWKGRFPLACPDQATVIAGAGETSLRAFDARTGKERWTATVPAEPQEITAGQGCVGVLVKGGTFVGVRLDSGEVAPCPSAPEPDPARGPRGERTQNPRVIQAGDVELQLSAATGKEPKLTLEGRRAGAALWSRPLEARATGFGPDLMVAASGGTAVVVGSDIASGARLRFIGVEVSSGRVLYERPANWAGPYVATMAVSGPHLVVIAGGSMRALEVASGSELWEATMPPAPPATPR